MADEIEQAVLAAVSDAEPELTVRRARAMAEGTIAELRRRGVRFEAYDFPGLKTIDGIADLGYEKSAWFRDSEGNLLALGQLA